MDPLVLARLRAKLIDRAADGSYDTTFSGKLGAVDNEIRNGILYSSRKSKPIHFLYSIDRFSSLVGQPGFDHHESEIFESGSFKWKVCLYPQGDSISLSLRIVNTESLEVGWEVNASITFFIYSNTNDKYLTFQDMNETEARFHERKKEWKVSELMSLAYFMDINNGLVEGNTCSIGAEVLVLKQRGKKQDLSLSILKEPGPDNSFTFKWLRLSDPMDTHYPFLFGGAKWNLHFHPAGWDPTKNKYVTFSLNLKTKEFNAKGREWRSIHRIRILDQINGNDHEVDGGYKCFNDGDTCAAIMEFMPLNVFNDRSKGYIKADTVIIKLIFSYMSVH